MQRNTFAPPPAHSPPLHHPVPQHVSHVPMMRSPPPPTSQPQQPQTASYGNPYQPAPAQGGSGTYGPGFGQFMNDPTAQMGFQAGQYAVKAGQEYMEQNLNRYVSIPALKHYFNVTNSYVVAKLALVLFPWRHKPWSRQHRASMAATSGQISQTPQYASYFLAPAEDVNSPDLYIPTMAVVTYILLSTLLAGFRGSFHPELLGSTMTTAFAVVAFEIVCLKVAMYLLSISNDSQLLDLIAYSGYKFVGIIVTLAIAEIFSGGTGSGGWIGWAVFTYTFLANAFFLLRSLKYVLLPDASNDPSLRGSASTVNTVHRAQRARRTQFLFIYSYIIQFFFMWVLSRDVGGSITNKVPGVGPGPGAGFGAVGGGKGRPVGGGF